MTKQYKEDTVLIHGGQEIDSATGSRAVPIIKPPPMVFEMQIMRQIYLVSKKRGIFILA